MELSETIRTNFERFREQKGVTIAQIARDKGVTRQTIYSYFRSSVSLITLQKLANIVGVEPWQLLKPNTQNQATAICPHCGKQITIAIEK